MSGHGAVRAGTEDESVPTPRTSVVRAAGVTTAALRDLHGLRASRLLRRIIDLDREIRHRGANLADRLFTVIGDTGPGPARPRLVALRRALHRGVLPKAVVWNADLAHVVGPELADAVDHWCSRLDSRARAERSLAALVAADTDECVGALRGWVREPMFHHGLATASAATAADVDRWLARPGTAPSRRLLTTLVGYLGRAGAKTSPFSTFMVSALGSPAHPAAGRQDVGIALEPKALFIERARRAVLDQPSVRDHTRLRVNPSVRVEPHHLEFLGVRPLEAIVRLPRSMEVDAVVAAAARIPVRSVLVEDIAAQATAPADVVDRFVSLMLAANVLEAVSPAIDQSPRPFADLADWWTEVTGDGGQDIPALLLAVDAALGGAEEHRPDPRTRDRHGQVLRAAQALCDYLSPDAVPLPRPQDDDDLLHETVVDRTPRPALPVQRWEGDLRLALRWLAPFELTLPLRLVVATLFEEWFGAGAEVPFLHFHRSVQERLGEASGRPGPEPLSALIDLAAKDTPRLAELERRQHSALALARGSSPAVAREEVVAEVASRPLWLDLTPASLGCYVQATTHADPLLVLNAITPGDGRGISRVRRLITGHEVGQAQATREGAGTADDPIPVDLSGTFGSALNLRTVEARTELHYPGIEPMLPASSRIPLSDLTVSLDAERGLLVVRARGRGVIQPRHTGMMSVLLLPPAARLLVQVFGPAGNFPPPWAVFDTAAAAAPRVRLGDVILRRSQARIPAPALRRLGSESSDADYLLRLARVREEAGVAERCFARTGAWAGKSSEWRVSKAHKPFYVDFTSAPSVAVLERALARTEEDVVLEECLPDPLAAGVDRVTEHLVEIVTEDPR